MQHSRKLFPLLLDNSLIYFDSAATAQKPKSVIDSISHFYTTHYGTVHRAIYDLAAQATMRYAEVREIARRFLGALHQEEIIFTRGTTDAVNLVAQTFGRAFIEKGDEILIAETEHHSNIVPWQMLAAEKGALIKVLPVNDRGELILEEYEKMLSSRAKLVAVAHIANATGVIHPIEQIIAMAHKKGAKVFIDGAQSAPHMPIDVQKLDADFFAFSGHKAYGPTGIGILYGKKALLEEMPPYQGGGDMIDTVTFAHTSFQKLPLKFEAGTPSIAEVIGLGEALKFIESLGPEKIAIWESKLVAYAEERLSEIKGIRFIGQPAQRGAIISFVIEGLHPLDIGAMLNLKQIAVRTGHLCAQPTMSRFGVSGVVRASFGVYNNLEEIDRFISALQYVITFLRKGVGCSTI